MELSINPNTIQKAYAELERGGVIVSIKGRGSFISEDTQKLCDSRIGLIRQELAGLVEQSVAVGYAEKDFLAEAQRQFARRKEKSDD
jgi:GntR family transcriptional regulator